MADAIDQATLLRNKALAKKQKSGNRVTSEMRLAKVVAFLNNENEQFIAVEDLYAPGTKHTQIVAGFRTVIVENQLDELVYPIIDGDHVYLTKLFVPGEDDENEDEDN